MATVFDVVGVDAALLTALSLAVCAVRPCGGHLLRVDKEGHGHETLNADPNVSQTIGWLATMYPLEIALDNDDTFKYVRRIQTIFEALPPKAGFKYW